MRQQPVRTPMTSNASKASSGRASTGNHPPEALWEEGRCARPPSCWVPEAAPLEVAAVALGVVGMMPKEGGLL